MECKKIQEWILTDYLDEELPEAKSKEVRQHVEKCSVCREFSETVQRTAVAPFKEMGPLQPDPVLWQRIKEKITAQQEPSEGWLEKIEKALAWLVFPHPVLRLAVVTAVFLAAVVVVRWPSSYAEPAYAFMEEQMTFMGDLGSGNPDRLNGDTTGYEKGLEEIVR